MLIRKAENKDISRIAEIIVFTKRVTYRPIFKNDFVSFNEMQVVFEIERLKQPKELENIYVFDDGIVKAVVKVEEIPLDKEKLFNTIELHPNNRMEECQSG